jgi:hypothetical protein
MPQPGDLTDEVSPEVRRVASAAKQSLRISSARRWNSSVARGSSTSCMSQVVMVSSRIARNAGSRATWMSKP